MSYLGRVDRSLEPVLVAKSEAAGGGPVLRAGVRVTTGYAAHNARPPANRDRRRRARSRPGRCARPRASGPDDAAAARLLEYEGIQRPVRHPSISNPAPRG